MFYGAGAGKMPTASAVVADIIDAVNNVYASKQMTWEDGGAEWTTDPVVLGSAWYVRTNATREKIDHVFGEVIHAGEDGGETAFKTAYMNGKKIKELLDRGIPALSLFRVLGDY